MTDAEKQALLDAAAQSPASAAVDNQSVSARSADDLIKLLDHSTATQASANKARGLRFTRLSPPGSV